ncbi:MAG: AMP-binding protein [Planctomycetes bacterium]|nr:AMP-binding protein [Planctomycetota bacterium]
MAKPAHNANIARHLSRMARESPDRAAVITQADGVTTTFAELEARTNRYANGFLGIGIEQGVRVLVLIEPGLDFAAVVFALLKIGALSVLIDSGMGVAPMLRCIRQVRPEAMIGIPRATALRLLRPRAFKSVTHVVTVGRRRLWGGHSLQRLHDRSSDRFGMAMFRPNDEAAILFTSGSTGPAKGVMYTHGMFDAQVRSIQTQYGIEPGEVELATFPLFALFSPAMGTTCVFPDMDFSRPGRVDPWKIIEAVRANAATSAFGSPALWLRVSDYCIERNVTLPTLRRVLIAGAPVRWQLIERIKQFLDAEADVHTPYGATEALPVSSISGEEVLRDCLEPMRAGAGTCVGRPLPGRSVKIIRISDEPISEWTQDLVVPHGQRGEIVVSGEVVTRSYCELPLATDLAKIEDHGRVWHRMGDLGYFDEQGRLWFCGRKSQRVTTTRGTMFTEPCETVFNLHPRIARSALVGVGRSSAQTPVMVIECRDHMPSRRETKAAQADLIFWARAREPIREIQHVLFRTSLPVDVRHNAKINREALAAWAETQLR